MLQMLQSNKIRMKSVTTAVTIVTKYRLLKLKNIRRGVTKFEIVTNCYT